MMPYRTAHQLQRQMPQRPCVAYDTLPRVTLSTVWLAAVYPTVFFCLHRRFIFDNRLTGEVWQSLFDFINSVAMFFYRGLFEI